MNAHVHTASSTSDVELFLLISLFLVPQHAPITSTQHAKTRLACVSIVLDSLNVCRVFSIFLDFRVLSFLVCIYANLLGWKMMHVHVHTLFIYVPAHDTYLYSCFKICNSMI